MLEVHENTFMYLSICSCFAKKRKTNIKLHHVDLAVCPSVCSWNILARTARIFAKFYVKKRLVKSEKWSSTLHLDIRVFMIDSRLILSLMHEKFRINVLEDIKIYLASIYFPKIVLFFDRQLRKTPQSQADQMWSKIIWRKRFDFRAGLLRQK